MTVPIGDMQTPLRLQAFTTTKNAIGEPVKAWADVATIWAKRTNQISATAEAVVSGAEVAQQTVRFDIHPRAVDATMRLVDRAGVIYNIRSFALSNDRSELAVIATSTGEKLT